MRLTVKKTKFTLTDIKLHQKSRILEVTFNNGEIFQLPCEYLRVYTPSAEALGHNAAQEILQIGKENVNITEIKPIGHYGISPVFSDGHKTGIYSWDMLYKLGSEYTELWESYLQKLKSANHQRIEPLKN